MRKTLAGLLLFPLLINLSFADPADQPIPNCDAVLADQRGKLDFKPYLGKVLLVDFWATWCPPCKQSMPFLNRLRNQLLDQGFEIIAINVDENSEEAQQFLQQMPVDYPVAFDHQGHCPRQFNVKAMPSSYLVDKKGTIRKIHLGFREQDQSSINDEIKQLLAE